MVYTVMGDLIERWGKDTAGKYGYNALGAVVGATHPSVLKELRRRLEHTFFLVPGYGAQGGTAADVRCAFDELGRGPSSTPPAPLCAPGKRPARMAWTIRRPPGLPAEQMRDELRNTLPSCKREI